MEQIKKYIRGNSERGLEVIAELEKLGGKNALKLNGNDYDSVYYIERYKYTNVNTIDFVDKKSFIGQLIVTHPDWEEIELPEQFKDGDVVCVECEYNGITFIYKGLDEYLLGYASVSGEDFYDSDVDRVCRKDRIQKIRLATEEEKEKLFQAIKENGYRWNAETKTLEELIKPKFKVGDRVLWNYNTEIPRTISKVELTSKGSYVYWIDCKGCSSGWWSETELTPIPNKFDITTLKEFDSRVLVRSSMDGLWKPAIFGFRNGYNDNAFYIVGGSCWKQCIPYLNNEHLLGTTDDCDEYYKTWEE